MDYAAAVRRRRRASRAGIPSIVEIDPRLSLPDGQRAVETEDLGGGIVKTTYLDAPMTTADAANERAMVLPWGAVMTRHTGTPTDERWANLRD